jgi:hypothetical protein
LLHFHMAFSTCLIGKRKCLCAWAIKSRQQLMSLCIGGCVFCWRMCMATKSGRYANACSKGGCLWSLYITQVLNRLLELYCHKYTNLDVSICV